MSSEQWLSDKKVIVIDDQPSALMKNKAVLVKAGAESVACAESPENGLQMSNHLEPDIIFCDIQMDELSGYDVVDKLRGGKKLDSGEEIPIVMVSSKDDKYLKDYLAAVGASYYIKKPLSMKNLKKCLEDLGWIQT